MKNLRNKSLLLLIIIFLITINTMKALDDWTQQFPASFPLGRTEHDMSYIGDDKVVLFGGYDYLYNLSDETWVYDLSDNNWTLQSPYVAPSVRTNHAMAYIGEDKVLLFGGMDQSRDLNDETWIYDFSENIWTQKFPGTSPSPRYHHAMAYIGDDQVVLFGGTTFEVLSDETWIYDLSDNTWTQDSLLTKPSNRYGHDLAYIGNNQVLFFGGCDYDPGYDDETWIYDLGSDWTLQNPLDKPSGRRWHSMAYIGSDQVMLFGGQDSTGTGGDETWVYDLSDDNWILDSNTTQPSSRYYSAMSETSMDGSTYIVLFDGSCLYMDTWIFGGGDYINPQPTYNWVEQNPATYPPAVKHHDLTFIGGNNILHFGGDTYGVGYNDETWTYNFVENIWTEQYPVEHPPERGGHSLAYLNNDRALLYGGVSEWGYYLYDTWIYDFSDNSWIQQYPISNPSGRNYHDMAHIDAELVLLFGGYTAPQNYNDETWIYNLNDNSWTQLYPTNHPSARILHAMAYISSDKVLLFGGSDPWHDDETWIYDLSENNWTQQNPATNPSARNFHEMAYFGNDQVVLFSGKDADSNRLEDTWIYDLSENTWTQDDNPIHPVGRWYHALAGTGMNRTKNIVLFGGMNFDGSRNDTWIYGTGEFPLPDPEIASISIIDNEIVISWNEVTGATSYKIYSSTDPYESYENWAFEAEVTETSWSESVNSKKFYYVTANI